VTPGEGETSFELFKLQRDSGKDETSVINVDK